MASSRRSAPPPTCSLAPPSADLAAQEYRAELFARGPRRCGTTAGSPAITRPATACCSRRSAALLGVRLDGRAGGASRRRRCSRALAARHWGERAGSAAALWFARRHDRDAADRPPDVPARRRDRRSARCSRCSPRPRGRSPPRSPRATTLASPVAGLFVALAVGGVGARRARAERARAARLGRRDRRRRARADRDHARPLPRGRHRAVRRVGVLARAGGDRAGRRGAAAARASARCGSARCSTRSLLVAAFVARLAAGRQRDAPRRARRGPGRARRAARPAPARALLAALALPLAYWPLYPAVRDVVRASGDPSPSAAYYAPLLRFLRSRAGRAASASRSRSPRTTGRRATSRARGTDPARARLGAPARPPLRRALLRRQRSTPRRYRAWLDEHAVAYVARARRRRSTTPAATRRGSSRRGLPYLRPVWRDAHWRVFAVADPAPLADGAGARSRSSPTASRCAPRARGDVLVRVRHTRWWRVTARARLRAARARTG